MGNPPNQLFPISLLIDRVIARFNPNNCSGLNITYSFILDDYEPIYVEVKNNFATPIQPSSLVNIDTTIKTTHLTWQRLCMHEISAKDALSSNLVKCEGDIKNYFLLMNLIDENMVKELIYKHKESNNDYVETVYEELFETIEEATPSPVTSPKLNNKLIEEEIANEKAEEAKEQVKRAKINAKKSKKSAKKAKKDANKEKQKTKKMAKIQEKEKKRKQRLESIKSKKTIPIKFIMKTMVYGFNPKENKDLKITYKFVFDEEKVMYLKIKDKNAKLYSKNPGDVDTTINTSQDTWYKIIFEGLSEKTALLDGLVKCEGDIKNYEMLPKLFKINTKEDENIPNLYPVLNPIIWISLALVPWIFYWGTNEYLSSLIISSFATIYLILFIIFLKPSHYKKLTKLEALTFISFTTYHLLNAITPTFNEVVCSFLLNIILILSLLLSIGCKTPILTEYFQISFDPIITKTKLFKLINRNITLLLGGIFTIRFIIEITLPSPLSYIGYVFWGIGAAITYVYTKIKLGM